MPEIENKEVQRIKNRVTEEGQGHVFRYWDELPEQSKQRLLAQLQGIDFALMRKLKKQCLDPAEEKGIEGDLEPAEVIPIPKTQSQRRNEERARQVGEELIRAGKVGAFLVAGGQGTRLDYPGPKGLFPIGPVTGKSLFQMHAEKILAAGRAYDVRIPWYIMTSETNDDATRHFFRENSFFGLKEGDIRFLKQKMIPALDEQGKFILDKNDHIFMSPDGHGGSLLALAESGALEDMKKRGVEIISYFQVDNVLIKIVDPVFIGHHVQADAEMSSKMVRKRNADEKVGVFGRISRKLKVIEYSDMKEEDAKAVNPDGSLKYDSGSIAVHLMNTHFIEQEVVGGLRLPYHIAHKKIDCLNEKGEEISPDKPNGYKFETFVFDALADTHRSVVMEVERTEEFSPVKNVRGEDSPETARRDLCNLFGRWLESAGLPVPRDEDGHVKIPVEINPLFARNEEELVIKLPKYVKIKDSLHLG